MCNVKIMMKIENRLTKLEGFRETFVAPGNGVLAQLNDGLSRIIERVEALESRMGLGVRLDNPTGDIRREAEHMRAELARRYPQGTERVLTPDAVPNGNGVPEPVS